VHFIERLPAWAARAALAGSLLWLAGCAGLPAPGAGRGPAVRPGSEPAPQPAAPGDARVALPAPQRARDWDQFRHLAALRIVAANPGRTYDGPAPDPLLAIPVLEVELDAQGAVRQVRVMRHPTQAKDTTQLAIDAVRRAGPFGSVAHLPPPWKFVEVFLFDDERRFKPRTLDALDE
jgi:protein TonB